MVQQKCHVLTGSLVAPWFPRIIISTLLMMSGLWMIQRPLVTPILVDRLSYDLNWISGFVVPIQVAGPLTGKIQRNLTKKEAFTNPTEKGRTPRKKQEILSLPDKIVVEKHKTNLDSSPVSSWYQKSDLNSIKEGVWGVWSSYRLLTYAKWLYQVSSTCMWKQAAGCRFLQHFMSHYVICTCYI